MSLIAFHVSQIEVTAAPARGEAQPIPWSEIGTKADAQYSGAGMGLFQDEQGIIRVWCLFQRLEGEVTAEGLWLVSTIAANSSPANRFRVKADCVGREDGAMVMLGDAGKATMTGQKLGRYERGGVTEEFSSSVDGIRQDFIVLTRPHGTGRLRLELSVDGAKAQPTPDGAELILEKSGRKLAYNRLRVVDAADRELPAALAVDGTGRLAIMVEDAGAEYPVRIDPTFSDANWISLGGSPGANNTVMAVKIDGSGNLYIGGTFTAVGNVTAARIAKWNGSAWSALGGGAGAAVNALAIDSSGNLYAGGGFTSVFSSGTTAVSGTSRIAKWDGSSWSALGGGAGGNVSAVAVDSSGNVYAGGAFTAVSNAVSGGAVSGTVRVAKWNGSTWSALGGGAQATVSALATDSSGNLYAGGAFNSVFSAGTTTVTGTLRIAKWNGTAWSALGGGAQASVSALATDTSGNLYAGGTFNAVSNSLGGGAVSGTLRVAKWNGSTWSALGGGAQSTVNALAVDSNGNLYAGGNFSSVTNGTTTVPDTLRLAKWNGSAWSAVGGGAQNSVVALTTDSSGNLYAGGSFLSTFSSGTAVVAETSCIAKWNGSSWSGLTSSSALNFDVSALAISGNDLYVGGSFTSAGSVAANKIAKWNGSAWSTLGTGLNNTVRALAVSGSNLYVAGDFTTAGGNPALYIAKWDGSSWSALGSGMNATVYALALDGTDLYAGGLFTTAGGGSAASIAKWNGSAWSALGTGLNSDVYCLVWAQGNLYVGGAFTQAGGTSANRVAKWNGNAWSALGTGLDGIALSFAVSGTDLYVGGGFLSAGGVSALRIAKWNGSAWSALGLGVSTEVDALAVSGSDLYVGGAFSTAGGSAAARIAKWNGSAWSALGSGTDATILALAVSGSDLYVGGDFTTAGNKVSSFATRILINGLVATNATVARAPNTPLKIPIASLASDVNNNPVTIQSLGSSTQGATLSFDSTYIFFLPANNNSDTFTYTVSNGSTTATGSLTVSTITDGGSARSVVVSGGSATIRCFGIPGLEYDVQRTTSLTAPVTWTTLTTAALTPGSDGSFSYTDTSAPVGTAYYRSAQH